MPVPDGGLIDRQYAKDAVGFAATNTAKDALFDDLIVAATPMLERICGPIIPGIRLLQLSGGKSAVALPFRLASDQAVAAVLEDGVATTDFTVDAAAGLLFAGTTTSRTFAPGRRNIAVTVSVGYTPIPKPLQLAARALVKIWFQQDQASGRPSFDDAGQSDSSTVPQGFAVPRKVRELCGPYLLPPGMA